MPACRTCKEDKALGEMYSRPDRPNPSSVCRECARVGRRAANARMMQRNPNWMRDKLRARRADPETNARDLETRRKRYAARPDVRVQAKMGRDRYRESRRLATPAWADLGEIQKIYERATALGHEVDHIGPLRARNVSGLHVHWNLQILPKIANRMKSNRYDGAALAV